MKNIALLLSIVLLSATAVTAAEPLLLEPLNPVVLSTTPVSASQTVNPQVQTQNPNGVNVVVPDKNGVYEATFTPASKFGPNMVPQNAAAEGKPVPQKENPRVRIRTKQGRQTNSYWNAGGKGTKSFF